MKLINTALCAIIFGVVILITNPVSSRSTHLIGAKECTWGPSYWCSNITNAKNCGAVRHCIQTVWEKQSVPEDNDSVCKICLDMVKQARDQLESNETQSDLKAVFEGSCKLIPIKPVQKECIKLADNFIPELVEALASQMNPQVVCSVAGLCNNAAIDKMLSQLPVSTMKQHEEIEPTIETTTNNKNQLSCSGCNNVATIIANKFQSSNHDEILENLLHLCGRLSSFSDSCSHIVLTYFGDIYDQLSENLNAESICHMSGVCSAKYHSHPDIVEIRPMSNVGVVSVKEDIPCELCEQLVGHLRDLLVANTTESEFKQVLEGFCKQTHGFAKECLSIVDQYYDEIYKALINNLDANGACFLIGVCPKGLGSLSNLIGNHPIMPLLPAFPPAKIEVNIKEIPQKKKLLGENEPKFTKEEINSMQLPIDKIMGAPHASDLIDNGDSCAICEFFLHFVQEALATPANADKIKNVVGTTCEKFPTSLRAECHNFINTYGDAIIALLIQEIDPRELCPSLKLCPKGSNFAEDMEVFAPRPIDVAISQSEKPSCPLCLFAVTQAEQMIKEDRTAERVKHVLDTLCHYVPKKLQPECIDFIDTYSAELIQMLVNDLPPQKICVEIGLCTENPPTLNDINISIDSDEDTMTNEIPDNTVNGSPTYDIVNSGPECYLCKKIIAEALKNIVTNKSKAHIRDELERACEKIHKIKNKCRSYIDKYGDKIIDLIMHELSAKEICAELLFCSTSDIEDLDIDEALKIDIIAIPSDTHGSVHLNKMTKYDDSSDIADAPCTLCEFIMVKLEQELKDKKTQDEIKQTVHNICKKMPKTIANNCNSFVDQYADMILDLLDTVPPKQICQRLQLCFMLGHANDEIIECGVCHGTVTALVPLIEGKKNIQIQEMIEEACENLPAKYYGKCSDLIAYYGESILNLVKANTDESKICAKIGKCFKEEHSIDSYLRIGTVQDFDLSHIRQRRENIEDFKLVGADECTWGPSHWCAKRENADMCGTHNWCVEKNMGYAKQN